MKNVINDLAQMSQNKTTGGDGHNIVNCIRIFVEQSGFGISWFRPLGNKNAHFTM